MIVVPDSVGAPADFIGIVSRALTHFRDLDWLAASPLANSPLALAGMVSSADPLTSQDNGRGVQAMLRWGVEQLAPAPPCYPIGRQRPVDDPTWSARHWWTYNILRHRYLEPIPRARRFVTDGLIESLLALTGIPSRKVWLRIRRHAQRDLAVLLRESLVKPQAAEGVTRQAVSYLLQPLRKRLSAARVLNISVAWRSDIPQELLRQVAAEEGIADIDTAIEYLVQKRILGTRACGEVYYLSPAIRTYVELQQQPAHAQRRHLQLSGFYGQQGDIAEQVWHMQSAGQNVQAASSIDKLLSSSAQPVSLPVLRQSAEQIDPGTLPGDWLTRFELCRILLREHTGTFEEMLAACRAAAQTQPDEANSGRISLMFGQAYLQNNLEMASIFFRECLRILPADDCGHARALGHMAEIVNEQNEPDLSIAYERVLSEAVVHPDPALRATALLGLARAAEARGDCAAAVRWLREQTDLARELGWWIDVAAGYALLARSHLNTGEVERARQAVSAADSLSRSLGSRPIQLGVQSTMAELDLRESAVSAAIARWEAALRESELAGNQLIALRIHLRLARATAYLGWSASHEHWLAAFRLARETGAGRAVASLLTDPIAPTEPLVASAFACVADRIALGLAVRHGQVTPTILARMGQLRPDSARAVLTSLSRRQLLRRVGWGRAISYQLTPPSQSERDSKLLPS